MTAFDFVSKYNVVLGTAPANYTGAASTSDIISLKNYESVTVAILCGAWAAGTAAVTISQCQDVSATGAKALTFTNQWTNVADTTTDVLTKTAVTSNTFNLSVANAVHLIEITGDMLDVDNSFDCLRVNVASPGANADYYGVWFIVGNPRYAGSAMPTAITD